MNAWPLLHVGVFASVVMVIGWRWQRRSGNAGPVDVLWAGCLALAAPYCAWMSEGAVLPRVLVAVLGGVWGRGWRCIWAYACSATRTKMAVTARYARIGMAASANSSGSSWPRR